MRRHHAFTLIELLFVVAIIAILAAISVPNFLDAQTRSKIARIQCDMSALKAALRAYGAQHEAYPPNAPEILKELRKIRDQGLLTPEAAPAGPELTAKEAEDRLDFLEKSGWDLVRLTTPNAWLASSLPRDPFSPSLKNGYDPFNRPAPDPFVYINRCAVLQQNGATTTTMEGKGFMLLSYGPDGSMSLEDPLSAASIVYDPTNGTSSAGDLVLTGW